MATDRASELVKYETAYEHANYRLGDRRKAHILKHLKHIPLGSLLDVSTGRGEVLDMAERLGHDPVQGTEAVPYLCDEDHIINAMVHDLPFLDNAFDTVCMFDVMEHLVPGDTEIACKELKRVAKSRVLLTVHNSPSRFAGMDLHINRRDSYETWHEELEGHFDAPVIRHGREGSISEMFEVVI
jgi:SAM-dependent methyltransferase